MALLNTHNTVKKFISYGFTEEQAEGITETINDQNNELATKADINNLREATQKHLEIFEIKFNSKIDNLETKLESKIDNLEVMVDGDMKSLRSDIKWLTALSLAITAMLAKLVFFNG